MRDVITIEQAIEIAKKRDENVNAYQEYNDAWEFFNTDAELCEGGANCSFVVEKQGGNIVRWSEYFMSASRTIVEIGDEQRI